MLLELILLFFCFLAKYIYIPTHNVNHKNELKHVCIIMNIKMSATFLPNHKILNLC